MAGRVGVRILGVNPSPDGIAYVLIQDDKILQWGKRVAAVDDLQRQLAIVQALIEDCSPDRVVIEDPNARLCRRRERIKQLLRTIRRRFRPHLPITTVRRHELVKAWKQRGAMNKQQIAEKLGALYTELRTSVPPPRKKWEPEDYRIHIFDALALAAFSLAEER